MRPAIRAGRAAAKSRLSAGESDGRRSRVPPPARLQAPLRKRGPINRQRSCVRGTAIAPGRTRCSKCPQGGPVNMRGDYVTSHFEAPCASAGSFGAWPRRLQALCRAGRRFRRARRISRRMASCATGCNAMAYWAVRYDLSRFVTFSSFECSVAYGQHAG
jgi:hypothetical protein